MYESYAWPGAYSFKSEIKMIVKMFKKFFDGLSQKIDIADEKAS